MRFRSFKRGTLSLCRSKGCKIKSCQSWRSEKILPRGRSRTKHERPGFKFRMMGSSSKFDQLTTTLQPYHLQRPKVPLLKDLNIFCWHSVFSRDRKHLRHRFSPVKVTPFQYCISSRGIYNFFRNSIFQICLLADKCYWKRHSKNTL